MAMTNFWDSTRRNLRLAARTLQRAPVFGTTVVLTLALGIGTSSAVFSALDAVVLRALPLPDADRLVRLAQAHPRLPEPFVAPVRLEEWNRLNRTFEAITGYYTNDVTEASGDLPEKLTQALVAPRFLQVWRTTPALGRGFSAEEERFGGPAAAIISDALWHRRFGGRADVIGKTLRVGRGGYTIVGVMPSRFFFPVRTDLWSPSPMDAPFAQSRESTWFTAIGRLKPGVPLARARADLESVQAALGRQYPKTDAEIRPALEGLKDVTIGGAGSSLWMLFGSTSLLLVLACANVSALLLSRAAARRHEIALRFSLGASRASVVTQMLTEVLVLAVAGALLGLFVAAAASAVFRVIAANLPRIDEIQLNARVVCYSLACALSATLLAGLLPAVLGTRQRSHSSLAQASRALVARRVGTPLVLVGVQVALAVTLLAGAGLLVRSVSALARVNAGFDPARVLTFHVSTSWGETADREEATQRTARILDAVGSVPGVQAAAAAISLPGVPSQYPLEFAASGARVESGQKIFAEARWVTPGYFRTVAIPLMAGEECREEMGRTTAMVNRRFAETYLGGHAAIGQSLALVTNPALPPAQVRGIVGDARETGLDRDPVPTVYWCAAALQPGISFIVRTAGDPRAMAGAIRRRLGGAEPGRSVYGIAPLADVVSDAYGENRLRSYLLSFFSLAALSLACLGLYGALSYLSTLRQRETALRLALGAAPHEVLQQVVARGLRVAVPGCVGGLLLLAAVRRVLSGMLYGVSVDDPVTLTGVVAIVIAVCIAASLVPALRASRLDPMRVLHEE